MRFTFPKTLCKDPPRSFALVPLCKTDVCPVNWITYYLSVCDLLKVRLASGFFFRASDRSRDISPRPFVGSAVNNLLRGYLTEAKLHDGETPHSLQVGLSTTLRLLGCSQQQVAQYIGWKSGRWLNITPVRLMRRRLSRSSRKSFLVLLVWSQCLCLTPTMCNLFVPIE